MNTMYIVHLNVLSIANRPFSSLDDIRKIWKPVFDSEECYSKFKSHVVKQEYVYLDEEDDWGLSKPLLQSKPFIRGFGPLAITSDFFRFDKYKSDLLDSAIEGGDKSEKGVFGLDYKLQDQRMNLLYFQIGHPIFLQSFSEYGVRVQGKIFLHLYPSGYLALIYAFSINWAGEKKIQDIQRVIKETRPWRHDGKWAWESRIGNGGLHSINNNLLVNIDSSLYSKSHKGVEVGEWFTNIMQSLPLGTKDAAHNILQNDKYRTLKLDSYGNISNISYFLFSRNGNLAKCSPGSRRNKRMQLFWRFVLLSEFVLLETRIYTEYRDNLRKEIGKLKEYRLLPQNKLLKENIFKFSIFDPRISTYIIALDWHVRRLPPFYRKIYSELSTVHEFAHLRKQLLDDIEKWEDEASQWEHGLVMLWRKVVSPLRAILGD